VTVVLMAAETSDEATTFSCGGNDGTLSTGPDFGGVSLSDV